MLFLKDRPAYCVCSELQTFIYAKEYISRNFRKVFYRFISKNLHRCENFFIFPCRSMKQNAHFLFTLQKRVKNYQRSTMTQDRLNGLDLRVTSLWNYDLTRRTTRIESDLTPPS